MPHSRLLAVAAIPFLAAAPASAARAQGSATANAAMQAHIDSARALSHADVSPALSKVLCGEPKEVSAFLAPIVASSKPMPPARAFDQLYYLGMDFVGAWALTTSDGIILFDALNTPREAHDVIEPGMRSLGLDPATIRYVVVMHGHGDHYGGARYLQERYGAKVLMSAEDWEYAPRWLADWTKAGGSAARFGELPRRDGVVTDGQRLTLGGTTVTLYVTPGHTPGTLSALIPVTDGGTPHLVSFWGGTALPNDLPGKRQYERSLERFLGIVDSARVDAVISNHPFIDGTAEKVVRIGARRPGEPNPFVIGHDAALRYMGVHLQCTRASELR
jgi:metallo-beta-lactamase class B